MSLSKHEASVVTSERNLLQRYARSAMRSRHCSRFAFTPFQKQKRRPRPPLSHIDEDRHQAVTRDFLRPRREKPTAPKPIIISAQVAGSGTPVVTTILSIRLPCWSEVGRSVKVRKPDALVKLRL